jgi:pimeloyl-ACP methyl ester carboxylesterase
LLVVHGNDDVVVPPVCSTLFFADYCGATPEKLPHSTSHNNSDVTGHVNIDELLVLSDCGHDVMLEKPATWQAAVVAFLRGGERVGRRSSDAVGNGAGAAF